jgi:Zn-finger nucleic acid-binding protein
MIARFLCWLAYHKLKTLEEMSHYELVECQRCKRRWIVQGMLHKVWEVTRG